MLKYLILLVALLLSGIAGYYSVFGLSKLFAGSFYSILIMASIIEIGKIISATILKRHWNDLTKSLRIYLFCSTILIMIITSLGIYGFLTSSYQETINKKSNIDTEINKNEMRKDFFNIEIKRKSEILESNNNRINKLTEIRLNQENRLDSLYNRKMYYVAKRTEEFINNSNIEISKINLENEKISKRILELNDSIMVYQNHIIEIKSSDVSSELGPLIYISELSGMKIDSVVNILSILIILVFDPLAIILLLVFNQLDLLQKNNNVIEENNIKKEINNVDSNKAKEEVNQEDISKYSIPKYIDIEKENIEKIDGNPNEDFDSILKNMINKKDNEKYNNFIKS